MGRENHPIRVVNDVDDSSVGEFIYAPKSRPWKDRELDNSIESRQVNIEDFFDFSVLSISASQ